MNGRTIKALLKKDFSLFTSNRFYLLITIVGLVFYIGIYFILPAQLDEKLNLAMYAPVMPPAFAQVINNEGADVRQFTDEETMKQAVRDSEYQAGIALPADIMDTWAAGQTPVIKLYSASGTAPEISAAIGELVKELAYIQTGQSLKYVTSEEILGPDMLGNQIALRDRMKPMLAVFILLVEILTLSSLIATEIEQGTARALLVTPLRMTELFLAKGLLGVGLALGQSVLFMGIVGGFSHQPLIILLTLIIGSVMVVGLGFLLASVSRDVTAVTGWGLLLLIILMIPGFGTAIPGLISGWAKVIPSYYLTDTVNQVANYGVGWSDIGMNLGIITAFTAVVIWAGMATLRRRYQ
jgi:ABC-2 type transport system permease protein